MKKGFLYATVLFAFITVVCGFWMASQEQVEVSSKQFHMTFGLATIVSAFITIRLSSRR